MDQRPDTDYNNQNYKPLVTLQETATTAQRQEKYQIQYVKIKVQIKLLVLKALLYTQNAVCKTYVGAHYNGPIYPGALERQQCGNRGQFIKQ